MNDDDDAPDDRAITDDGSAKGSAAPLQMPRLLNDYQYRPEWSVAGVDYAVGPPDSLKLKDWHDIDMPGVEVNNSTHVVTVRESGTKLNGIDFSTNEGATLYITGASDVAVTKCKFGGRYASRASAGVISSDPASPNLTVKYCDLDGNGPGQAATLLFVRGGGKTIMQYNYFHNFPQHVVEFVDDLGDVDYRWNMIAQGGQQNGAHLNHLQLGAGTGTLKVLFNTFVQEGAQAASGEGVQCYFNSPDGAELTSAIVSNNTCIARGGEVGMVMSYMFHGGRTNDGRLENNYFDPSATWGPLYPESFAGWVIADNKNMIHGTAIP